MPQVKIGALCWNQYSDWPALLEAGIRADEVGYDSLWTWDHVYPIVGDSTGPNYEGWLTITAWAQATRRVTVGLMVGANTFRMPTLTAKMATTLDHISGGRAILGIGGAWFEYEHTAHGMDFGSGFGQRLDWLDEATAASMSSTSKWARVCSVSRPGRRKIDSSVPPPAPKRTDAGFSQSLSRPSVSA